MQTSTYLASKKALTFSKISVSVVEVSSNPGVSMRVIVLPSRMNSSESWTWSVHDSKPVPTRRFEPLARLINWMRPSEFLVAIIKRTLLTDVFPL